MIDVCSRLLTALDDRRFSSFHCTQYLKDCLKLLIQYQQHIEDSAQHSEIHSQIIQQISTLLNELLILSLRIQGARFFRKSRFSSRLSFLSHRLLALTSSLSTALTSQEFSNTSNSVSTINSKLHRISIILGLSDGDFYSPSDPEKAIFLAHQYYHGRGVPTNLTRAFNLYQAAGKSGLAEGFCYSGIMLIKGEGVRKDPVRGLDNVNLSGQSGHFPAFAVLGELFTNGLVVESVYLSEADLIKYGSFEGKTVLLEVDYAKARECYEACLIGESNRKLTGLIDLIDDPDLSVVDSLSMLLLNHFPEDSRLGFELLEYAAKNDHPSALNNLGSLYYSGKGPVAQNYQQSIRLFQKAADFGSTNALYNIGVVFEDGKGCGMVDLNGAADYYQMAIKHSIKLANTSLGRVYLKQTKYSLARSWLRVGSDHHCKESLFLLGELYRRGLGGVCDLSAAFELLSQSASLGNLKALTAKGDLLYGGFGSEGGNVRLAAVCYASSALAGEENAMYKLGVLLEEKELNSSDISVISRKINSHLNNELSTAEYWYIQACRRLNPFALLCLSKLWLSNGSLYLSSESESEYNSFLNRVRNLLLIAFALEVEGAEELLRKVELDLRRAFAENFEYFSLKDAKNRLGTVNVNDYLPETELIDSNDDGNNVVGPLLELSSTSDLELEALSPNN
ncbi:hypothetical protein P9112_008873 [Eukaryota sp. TZLM1-RC]